MLLKCKQTINNKKMFLACFRQNISTKRSHALLVEKKQDSLFILLVFFQAAHRRRVDSSLVEFVFPRQIKV